MKGILFILIMAMITIGYYNLIPYIPHLGVVAKSDPITQAFFAFMFMLVTVLLCLLGVMIAKL